MAVKSDEVNHRYLIQINFLFIFQAAGALFSILGAPSTVRTPRERHQGARHTAAAVPRGIPCFCNLVISSLKDKWRCSSEDCLTSGFTTSSTRSFRAFRESAPQGTGSPRRNISPTLQTHIPNMNLLLQTHIPNILTKKIEKNSFSKNPFNKTQRPSRWATTRSPQRGQGS